VNPWDLFNPANFNPLDPQQLLGQADASKLLDAAQRFPGGPGMLVFALFWAPIGPGIPAGVLLARHAGLNPLVTLALYALSDVLGACVCHPMFVGLRGLARRVRALRWLGQRLMKVAMFGARVPTAADLEVGVKGLAPALFRIGTVGFGLDVYHGGMLVAGLPVPRLLGWAAAMAGDLVWFAVLLVTSIATAAVVDDDRVVAVVVLIAMFVLPMVAKRLFPVLRDPAPAPKPPVTQTAPQEGHVALNGAAGTVLSSANGATQTRPTPALALAGSSRGPDIRGSAERTAAVAASYLPHKAAATAAPNGAPALRPDGRAPRKGNKSGRSGKKARRR
jgi:hypothetical protein